LIHLRYPRRHCAASVLLASTLVWTALAAANELRATPTDAVVEAPAAGSLPQSPPPLPPSDLSYNLRVDLPLAVASYAAWKSLLALHPVLAPGHCRWCDEDLNPVDGGARDALRWPKSKLTTAQVLSDLSADGLAPAATVGVSAILAARDERFGNVPVDILVTVQAVSLAGVVTQLVKYSAGRMRPAARALPPDERSSGRGSPSYVSFYSGHSSYAFSLASAAGTIASMRHYPGAGWVWASGLLVASATGYFRIAADQHYLTDVLAGAAGASLIGFAVPYFLHRPAHDLPFRPGLVADNQGAMVTVDVLL
jgi:membrane-associated phospholipid phosphatase